MNDHLDRVLVTGGGGFIGSHLAERLVKMGYVVKVLDDFTTGREDNLAGVAGDLELIHGDVRDSSVVERTVKDVDTVVHLAALTDIQESVEKPLLYHEVNSTGTLNLLNSAKHRVKRFIYASTCAVYGHPVKLPIREDDPADPLSPYAASKLSAESYCRAYSKSHELNTTILRLFNVYGPRQGLNRYSGVITEFTRRIKENQPPVIFGDGEQTRDFIYVGDVVDLLAQVVEGEANGIFNVGTGDSVSINRLAEVLLKILKKDHLRPVHTDPKPGEVRHSRADISRTNRVFKFKPRVTLETGLRKTIGENDSVDI